MADTAKPTLIREALAARLQAISSATGYRTDIGADVRTEPSKWEIDDGTRVTVFSAARNLPADARSRTEREMQIVVEVVVPVMQGNELALCDAAEADIEDALRDFVQMPMALPLQITESVTLDRPDGLAAMVIQMMMTTRYR